MTFLSIDVNSHPQILRSKPVDFDLVVDEVVDAFAVSPEDGEIIHDESKSHRSGRIAEDSRGAW